MICRRMRVELLFQAQALPVRSALGPILRLPCGMEKDLTYRLGAEHVSFSISSEEIGRCSY